MQEDVENKTVRLAVQTLKLTFRVIYNAWKKGQAKLEREMEAKKTEKRIAKKAEKENVTGEQTVKELIGKGEGVAKIDIEETNLKDFKKMAKKFGVDFAVVKDKREDPPVYTIFFKAKDGAAIDKAMEAYAEHDLKMDQETPDKAPEKEPKQEKKKDRKQEREKAPKKKRPSVLKKLAENKAKVAKTPRKVKEKKKELNR